MDPGTAPGFLFLCSVSGDQTPPGPSNSGGGAVAMAGKPGETTVTVPSGEPAAEPW